MRANRKPRERSYPLADVESSCPYPADLLFTMDEAAEKLRCKTAKAAYRRFVRNGIPFVREAGSRCVKVRALDLWNYVFGNSHRRLESLAETIARAQLDTRKRGAR